MNGLIEKISKINISVMNDVEGKPVIYNLDKMQSRKDLENKTEKQVKKENPKLYYDNGNRAVEHTKITDKKITKIILDLIEREVEKEKNIDISSSWENCNGIWWNQFCIRIYDVTPVYGNTIFHSTGQERYNTIIDTIINIVNQNI